jgi:hypothetical protein
MIFLSETARKLRIMLLRILQARIRLSGSWRKRRLARHCRLWRGDPA